VIYQGAARYPVRTLVVHCTATPANWRPGDTPQQRVAAIRRIHMVDRGWKDVGYHWLIDRDGTVVPGRPETQIGSHVAGHNTGSLGISLFGGIASKPRDPFLRNYTREQEAALAELIRDLQGRTDVSQILGHNQLDSGKACPGFYVPAWLAEQKIAV